MECIYLPELNETKIYYSISGTEAHHLKVIRINTGDTILVTNGKGISALANMERISKENYSATIKEFYKNIGELDFNVGLAIGILNNRDRFEFCLEKCVELGITDFYPLITDYSQNNKINIERLKNKSISTLKQCKRSVLPTIYNPISIIELLEKANRYDRIIIADESGIVPTKKQEIISNTFIFIGPEGGFSDKEIELFFNFSSSKNIIKWNLGNRRLRAETAAIIGVSLLSFGF